MFYLFDDNKGKMPIFNETGVANSAALLLTSYAMGFNIDSHQSVAWEAPVRLDLFNNGYIPLGIIDIRTNGFEIVQWYTYIATDVMGNPEPRINIEVKNPYNVVFAETVTVNILWVKTS